MRERAKIAAALEARAVAADPVPAKPRAAPARKLSAREKRELEELPARIESLESEQAKLGAKMADPVFYQRERGAAAEVKARLDELERLHATAFARWEELEGVRAKG